MSFQEAASAVNHFADAPDGKDPIYFRGSDEATVAANVEGRLRPGLDAIDVLKASFPAGTVTGAPKVRAMQIIDELEPVKRGIYSGAVGWLGFNGDMDVAIAIRTAVLKDGRLPGPAAAGIVADSDPRSEWLETQHKTRAVLKAAGLASVTPAVAEAA